MSTAPWGRLIYRLDPVHGEGMRSECVGKDSDRRLSWARKQTEAVVEHVAPCFRARCFTTRDAGKINE